MTAITPAPVPAPRTIDVAGAFTIGTAGLLVIDRCYIDRLEHGIALADAAPGRWSARIFAEEAGIRRVLEVRHESALDPPSWSLVDEDLCTDTPILGVWDAARFVADHAAIAAAPLDDAVVEYGAQILAIDAGWRCEVRVDRVDGVVLGVRMTWFSLEWSEAQWDLPGGGALVVEERGLVVVQADGQWREYGLGDLHAEGLDALADVTLPGPLREHLEALFRRHGVGRAAAGEAES